MSIYLFDTGPLLCFASFPEGPKLLNDRYYGHASIMTDVDRELRGLRNNSMNKVAAAATRSLHSFNWMARELLDDETLLKEIELVRDVIDAFRRKPKGANRRDGEDFADASAIVWAKGQQDCIVVMNDTPARKAAESRGITTICVVDILRRMCQEEIISDRQALRFALHMGPEIDVGDVVQGVATFR